MSLRDPALPLREMRDHAVEAMDLVRGHPRGVMDTNRVLSLAIVRLLEILGEAARRVSPEVRQLHPILPWAQMIGLRNRLIHGYDSVDFDVVWTVLTTDLPPLVEKLDEILRGNPLHGG